MHSYFLLDHEIPPPPPPPPTTKKHGNSHSNRNGKPISSSSTSTSTSHLPPLPPLPALPILSTSTSTSTTNSRATRVSPTKREKSHTINHSSSTTSSSSSNNHNQNQNHNHHSITPLDHILRAPKIKEWTAQEAATTWGLPDHLKHLNHLLPSATPLPILVPVFSRVPIDSSNSSSTSSNSNSKGKGKKVIGSSSSSSSNNNNGTTNSNVVLVGGGVVVGGGKYKLETIKTHSEPPTRVKFPNKRMTMPEMKKRSRNVLDYLTRIQLELAERDQLSGGMTGRSRMEALLGVVATNGLGGEGGEGVEEEDSLRMMDALTKDVILFQQRFFGDIS